MSSARLTAWLAFGLRVVLRPAGDRARDIDVHDGALKVGRANTLLTEAGEPVADLLAVPFGGSLGPEHALSKFRQLSQFRLHVSHVFHAFVVIAVAMPGHDWHSLTRHNSG